MFIGIVGPSCSGKHEIMHLLGSIYGFTPLYLNNNVASSIRSNIITTQNGNENQESGEYHFSDIEAMLDFVTLNWMKHYVTCDVTTVQGIAVLRKRPFFLLLSVESPMMARYRRCLERCLSQGVLEPSLESFVEMSDISLYTTPRSNNGSAQSNGYQNVQGISRTLGQESQETLTSFPLMSQPTSPSPPQIAHFESPSYKLLSISDVSILNNYSDIQSLEKAIIALDITNPDLLRPSWDSYFMYLANLAARRSNCMKRRVGCVLVRENRVIATGYNGTPKYLKNCNEGGCTRCNQATPCGQGLDRCLCMHAEENALLEAGRERVGSGSTIYCNTCPCLGCAIKIVQVGVSQVVYSESYGMDVMTAEVLRKAGVELRQHATPGIKLDHSNP
ncbi:Deoxycytidine monophosphate (dCMP) deaminase [Entomortierella beljakovae]|nr:Deoxycytidine monophosphate (dCMP) deaminase [Entomortierella beljakovae]